MAGGTSSTGADAGGEPRQESAATDSKHGFKARIPLARMMWNADIPVVRAEVVLLDADGGELGRARTDDYGYFDLGGRKPDRVEIAPLEHWDAERVLHVQLLDGASGEPVRDTPVAFTEFGVPQDARTDDEGVLKVEALTDYAYWLKVLGRQVEAVTVEGAAAADPPCRVWLGEGHMPLADDDEIHMTGGDDDEDDFDAEDSGEIGLGEDGA